MKESRYHVMMCGRRLYFLGNVYSVY
jgi:hypothetical protein